MKFSKFVKAPQQKKASSASIYRKFTSASLNASSPGSAAASAQQLLLTDDICRFQPQKNKLFLDDVGNATPSNAKLNLSHLVNGSGSSKFAKSSQPKRLQRNRLQHVTTKPVDYVLRSTLNLQSGVRVRNRLINWNSHVLRI